MAQVTVVINGKTYRMACEEGQEEHLFGLADRLNGYVGQLKGSFGEIGDQRLTVMAGITVIDELQEAQRRISTLEAEIETLRANRDEVLGKSFSAESELTRQITAVAERIEAIAGKLSVPNPAK